MGGGGVDSPKIGCVRQTLLAWVQRHEIDNGQRAGVTTAEAKRVKALEREVRELRQANEILRKEHVFCRGGAGPPVQP